MSVDPFYSNIPFITPKDARVDASGTFRLRKPELRKDPDNKTAPFAAYSTTAKCVSLDPPAHQCTLRIYIYGKADAEEEGTLISASGYFAFGVHGRGVALHFHKDNVQVWPKGSSDPPGIGVVRCSFMGVIGKASSRKAEGGTTWRWEVKLLRAGEPFNTLALLPPVDEQTSNNLKRRFVPGRIGFYTSQLAQLGLEEDPKFPIFAIHTMQTTSFLIPRTPGPEATTKNTSASQSVPSRATSLSPTPPPQNSRKRERDAADLPSEEHQLAKKGKQSVPQESQPASSTARSGNSGRTINLNVVDTQTETS